MVCLKDVQEKAQILDGLFLQRRETSFWPLSSLQDYSFLGCDAVQFGSEVLTF
jgi:hypothetical protein